MDACKTVLDEGVDVAVRDRIHTAAPPAVAAVRAALGNVFLAPERSHPIAPFAGVHFDQRFVDKFHGVANKKALSRDRALRHWIGRAQATGTIIAVCFLRGPLISNFT